MRAMVLVAMALAWSTAGLAAPLPFVGCPSDGQTGPVDAPAPPGRTPPSTAKGLAYYSFGDMGVLAPQGWHCIGLYGSNGSILLVTPQQRTTDDFLLRNGTIAGPGVQLTLSLGDTSGRFEVARIAARLFPSRRAFVQSVIREGVAPARDFPFGPYPADTLQRRGAADLDFTTPGGRAGIGTQSRLKVSGQPIHGLVRMTATNDLEMLCVRLPPKLQRLTPVILQSYRRFSMPPPQAGASNP